jgi:transcriptional regulator with XRE-family HTH domain
VETEGGPEAFDASVQAMLDQARGWRLAELRKRRGLTQAEVAARMDVSTARVSQIENGDVSTQDVLQRYVAALGGTLKLIVDFGDEQLDMCRRGGSRRRERCRPTVIFVFYRDHGDDVDRTGRTAPT